MNGHQLLGTAARQALLAGLVAPAADRVRAVPRSAIAIRAWSAHWRPRSIACRCRYHWRRYC
ncbi:MAG TPA: hypothetical protein VNP92_26380 [Actinophytocola sp.]|nr:hypothetical protein [Actinophytocola sp.]